MIVRARAPLRLGFGGGGSDLATINTFVYAVAELHGNGPVRFVAADRRECLPNRALSQWNLR